jgi:hypothetical protein
MNNIEKIIKDINAIQDIIKKLQIKKKEKETKILDYMISHDIDKIQLNGGSISKKFVQIINPVSKTILKEYLQPDIIDLIYKTRNFNIKEVIKYEF